MCDHRDACTRGDRHLVRLRRDALRAVGLSPRARSRDRGVRGVVPRRLHLRGDRPDAGVVLHADGRGGAAVRRDGVSQRGVPRPPDRRGRPQDVQVARQPVRSVGGARPPGRRRLALVDAHERLPLGVPPDRARDPRRARAPVPAAAVERLRLLRDVRERERGRRRRGGRDAATDPMDRWIRSQLAEHRRASSATGWRPTTRRPRGAGSRPSSTICRRGTCGVHAAASGTPAPAGTPAARQPSPRCTCASSPWPAPGAVHAVHRRRALAQPRCGARRTPRLGAPVRLPRPDEGAIDPALDAAMATARQIVELGRRVRTDTKMRTRQPLTEAVGARLGARPRRRGPPADRRARSSTCTTCGWRRPPTRSAPGARSPTSRCSVRGSVRGCKRWRRRSPRTTAPSPRRLAGRPPGHDRARRRARRGRSATTTSSWRTMSSRAGASPQTAASRSRWSSSSRPSCVRGPRPRARPRRAGRATRPPGST